MKLLFCKVIGFALGKLRVAGKFGLGQISQNLMNCSFRMLGSHACSPVFRGAVRRTEGLRILVIRPILVSFLEFLPPPAPPKNRRGGMTPTPILSSCPQDCTENPFCASFFSTKRLKGKARPVLQARGGQGNAQKQVLIIELRLLTK